MEIRTLRADEIECRVQQVTDKGCIILVYKNARCDMKILDEVFGPMNWKRTHEVINDNLFCNIDIWDKDKNQWVRKQDVGVESNTEKEKGEASDSFKRAGFNVGIGRELYTAPFIWINLAKEEIAESGGRKYLAKGVKFDIKSIEYNLDREITALVIVDNKGVERFNMGGKTQAPKSSPKPVETPKIPEQQKVEQATQGQSVPTKQVNWERVDKDMTELKSLEELKAYWTTHKEWQIEQKFKDLKNKHKARIDETQTK